MSHLIETNEFSVVLLIDQASAVAVETMRRQLPPSPFRYDTPHITLLRGISSQQSRSDEQLRQDIALSVEGFIAQQPTIRVKSYGHTKDTRYDTSSCIHPTISTELVTFRQQFIEQLQQRGYDVEQSEVETYKPHITITLGVSLDSRVADFEKLLPLESRIQLVTWRIFRTCLGGDKRQIREVKPR